YTVDRMNSVRLGLDQRAATLAASDPLVKDLKSWSASVDDLRKKIVATKEGGMITGEERLRENLTDLYGNVVDYEGKPSQTQVDRADALARQLADVAKQFDGWAATELPKVHATLTKHQMETISPLTREQWESKNVAQTGGAPDAVGEEESFERDR